MMKKDNRIINYLHETRSEIIESVSSNRESDNQRKTSLDADARKKRELGTIIRLLVVGEVYIVVGVVFLSLFIKGGRFAKDPYPAIIGGIVLLFLGVYALVYSCLLFCMQEEVSERKLAKKGKEFLICLMFPYHICIKGAKKLIKDNRQEHVIYLLPYYCISIFIVLFLFVFVAQFISCLGLSKSYDEVLGFIIVIVLVTVFWGMNKGFAYLSTKSLIWSVQKAKVKRTSKGNWRGTLNNSEHKKERKSKFEEEWKTVKKELEYSKIYFYMLLTILIICMPREEGSLMSLLKNQFMGITTIAALWREVRAKNSD